MGIFGLFKPSVDKMKANRDVEGLIKALKHKDWHVRADAARALGEIKDKRAGEALIEALRDKASLIPYNAAYALGEIRDERAIEPIVALALKGRNEAVRTKAAEALDKLAWKPRTMTEKGYYLVAKGVKCSRCPNKASEVSDSITYGFWDTGAFGDIGSIAGVMCDCTICPACGRLFCRSCQRPVPDPCPECGRSSLKPGFGHLLAQYYRG